MHRLVASMVAVVAGVALSLAAVLALFQATLYVERIAHPLARIPALAGLVVFGVIVLLGSVYVATQLAVRLWGRDRSASQ